MYYYDAVLTLITINILFHCCGFVQKKLCLTYLLQTVEDWTLALDSGHQIDIVFLNC